MAEGIDWTVLTPPERKRTYVYPNGENLVFEEVTRIEIRQSGTHRLEYKDGGKAFVVPGYRAIILEVDEWTR
jgi:hypothetical protein